MQTFMPMIEYRAALETLDDARLNKQILEVTQLANAIMDPTAGYQHHPATRMWRPHVLALLTYGISAAGAWARRKRISSMERSASLYSRQVEIAKHLGPRRAAKSHQIPPWVGDVDFHESHRSNLIRKDPIHYNDWPGTPELMPYLWPVTHDDGSYSLYVCNADRKRLKNGERVLPEYLVMLPDGEVVDGEEEEA